jgi:hypothetical protein
MYFIMLEKGIFLKSFYGNVAGFTLQLQDRSGGSVDNLAFSDDMPTEISMNSRNTFVWYAGCIHGHGSVRSGR